MKQIMQNKCIQVLLLRTVLILEDFIFFFISNVFDLVQMGRV